MGMFDGGIAAVNGVSVSVGEEQNRGLVGEARYMGPVAVGSIIGVLAPTATISVGTNDSFETFGGPRASVGIGGMLLLPSVIALVAQSPIPIPPITGSLEFDTTGHFRTTLGASYPIATSSSGLWTVGASWVRESVNDQPSNGMLLSVGFIKN